MPSVAPQSHPTIRHGLWSFDCLTPELGLAALPETSVRYDAAGYDAAVLAASARRSAM